MRGFGSDNHSAVHPRILAALFEVNEHHMPSYGTDAVTELCEKKIKEIFGTEHLDSYLVMNGTGANVSVLKTVCRSYESVICSDVSHIWVDECGAPEMSACKLIPLKSQNGKITLDEIKNNFIRRGDQHFSQVKMISLTQPTELGTCYSLSEIREITQWAHQNQLYVHIDGSRLMNACSFLKTDLKTMMVDSKVDVISFGGTKNGLMMGEAVVFLNTQLSKDYKYIRKQLCQLPSKTRFISAQFLEYFKNDLYKEIASHSCTMASYLNEKLSLISEAQITQPVQSNAVFAILPKNWIKPLRDRFFFYVWDENTFECRLMTSWDTQKTDIDQFIELILQLKKEASL